MESIYTRRRGMNAHGDFCLFFFKRADVPSGAGNKLPLYETKRDWILGLRLFPLVLLVLVALYCGHKYPALHAFTPLSSSYNMQHAPGIIPNVYYTHGVAHSEVILSSLIVSKGTYILSCSCTILLTPPLRESYFPQNAMIYENELPPMILIMLLDAISTGIHLHYRIE